MSWRASIPDGTLTEAVTMILQEYTVCDRTTRLFHWISVLCIIALIALGSVPCTNFGAA